VKSEAEGHPRLGAIRLFAPSIAFDCALHSACAMIRVQRSRSWSLYVKSRIQSHRAADPPTKEFPWNFFRVSKGLRTPLGV